MNIKNHIKSLQKKHDDLQRLINAAFLHFQDDIKIKQLKKQKLMLKDKILLLYKNITNN
ncbi:DUF465 domain-containing protein [Candidatus Tisiphia endosymbiont of Oplodontha viridula]|uniref:DUF465 domain-containing protein n=1 Tax=Candidatus Tisiphia endosymbiont of Oplodontha viridula TaxID=3077925 RepID=UPI0035C89192